MYTVDMFLPRTDRHIDGDTDRTVRVPNAIAPGALFFSPFWNADGTPVDDEADDDTDEEG